jgi:uncharacterized membrane protein YhhN
MSNLTLIPLLAVTTTLLVRAQFRGAARQVYIFKPLSTLLVIVVALLSFATPGVQSAYTWGIVLGLLLSLGGDVALMFSSNKAFLAGLVLFLLAHVAYSIVLTVPNGFHQQDLITGALLSILAVIAYLYLRPSLGSMKGPVIAYMVIICFMVNRAASAFFGVAFSATQAWLLTVGATLFWLSDLVLAVNRFRHPFEANRLSLFLYYGGQLLIALSPSYSVWKA